MNKKNSNILLYKEVLCFDVTYPSYKGHIQYPYVKPNCVQFNSHSSFLDVNPERARKIGIIAMAPKEKATSGR